MITRSFIIGSMVMDASLSWDSKMENAQLNLNLLIPLLTEEEQLTNHLKEEFSIIFGINGKMGLNTETKLILVFYV